MALLLSWLLLFVTLHPVSSSGDPKVNPDNEEACRQPEDATTFLQVSTTIAELRPKLQKDQSNVNSRNGLQQWQEATSKGTSASGGSALLPFDVLQKTDVTGPSLISSGLWHPNSSTSASSMPAHHHHSRGWIWAEWWVITYCFIFLGILCLLQLILIIDECGNNCCLQTWTYTFKKFFHCLAFACCIWARFVTTKSLVHFLQAPTLVLAAQTLGTTIGVLIWMATTKPGHQRTTGKEAPLASIGEVLWRVLGSPVPLLHFGQVLTEVYQYKYLSLSLVAMVSCFKWTVAAFIQRRTMSNRSEFVLALVGIAIALAVYCQGIPVHAGGMVFCLFCLLFAVVEQEQMRSLETAYKRDGKLMFASHVQLVNCLSSIFLTGMVFAFLEFFGEASFKETNLHYWIAPSVLLLFLCHALSTIFALILLPQVRVWGWQQSLPPLATIFIILAGVHAFHDPSGWPQIVGWVVAVLIAEAYNFQPDLEIRKADREASEADQANQRTDREADREQEETKRLPSVSARSLMSAASSYEGTHALPPSSLGPQHEAFMGSR